MASRELAMMLDELMGKNRNCAAGEKVEELTWTSRGVCPYFLSDYCPHELFTNTKADLGACNRIHNDKLKLQFKEVLDIDPRKVEVQEDFLRFAQRLVGDLAGKIKRSKERLTLTQMEMAAANGISPEQQEEIEQKVQILTEKINELVSQAEVAGNSGDIEEAQGLLKLCDTLKVEREELKSQIGMKLHKLPPGFGGDGRFGENKLMEVCEICGAFMNFWVGQNDTQTQSRMDDHLMGKMHIGYARLRVTVDTLGEEVKRYRAIVDQEKEANKKETVFERNARLAREGGEEAMPAAEGSEEKPKNKEIKEEKEKEDSSSSKPRRRSRSKSRERKRSRSRDRRRRSRSRDDRDKRRRSRERRDRSKEKERKRNREDERKRSRSRDRKRRSRS